LVGFELIPNLRIDTQRVATKEYDYLPNIQLDRTHDSCFRSATAPVNIGQAPLNSVLGVRNGSVKF